MSRRILVTGGTGFLGSYIIKDLVENGDEVRAIRRSSRTPSWVATEILNRVDWVDGDVLDPVAMDEAMDGVDSVIHSAAVVSFSKADRKLMYQVNVEGTANVVNCCIERNIRRLVHISSVASLGRTSNGGHVNETRKWEDSNVNTHYAKSKFKGELEVWRAVAEGLDAVILNPSTILGYGDWNSSSCAIFKKVYEGFKWYGPGINGFVDVADVATVARLMIDPSVTGERFVVNGDNWPFKQLQKAMAIAFGKPPPSRPATPFLLNVARRMEAVKSLFTGHRPLITRESVRVAQSKTYFENDKILAALPGFRFTPLDDSITEACRRYLAQAKADVK